MDDPPLIHLQAMTAEVPACWRLRVTMTALGPMEIFGPILDPDEEASFTQHARLVTCPACRGLIQ